MYKITRPSGQFLIIRTLNNAVIPQSPDNRDYQQFLQDVKSQGITIVEGADVIAPDYVALRTGADGYASTGDQLGMIAAGDGSHATHVASVKTAFPKSNTGGTTIATVPDWVQEAADAVELQENP